MYFSFLEEKGLLGRPTTDGYITGRRSLDQDGNQYPIINLVFKHLNQNKTKSYRAVIP